jgi:hypothetical protein
LYKFDAARNASRAVTGVIKEGVVDFYEIK